MPILTSTYNPPFIFRNGHFSTVYTGLIRKVKAPTQQRERINLTDGDFLDLDWSFSKTESNKVLILLHGLEGNAQRQYITGSVLQATKHSYDCCAVNFRTCSGEMNRLYRSYHSGATEDLEAVIQHIINLDKYAEIYIKGFSLGANLTLKYLGERENHSKLIKGVVAVSAPCDLHSSLLELLQPKNYMYAKRFKSNLKAKMREKQSMFPNKISDKDIARVKTLKDFDDIYTSKAHGFIDALDYYKQCSSLQFLPNIKIPSLIINAKNDSFLGPTCYPYKEAENNASLYLETPSYGGHVGFYNKQNITYTEKRVIKFFSEL